MPFWRCKGAFMIRIALEENLPYTFLALLVLALFYGIYFAKMLVQKKHGITTRQIGKRKKKTLHTVETCMAAATYAIVPAQLASIAFGWNHMPQNARFTGFLIALVGDLIFLAAVICMKDSWRAGIPENDETKMVTTGLYAFSRNPAFLGFDFMYIGVFFMYANALTGVLTLFCILMLHLQILQEEKYLTSVFGDEYIEYKKRVFRYLGRK